MANEVGSRATLRLGRVRNEAEPTITSRRTDHYQAKHKTPPKVRPRKSDRRFLSMTRRRRLLIARRFVIYTHTQNKNSRYPPAAATAVCCRCNRVDAWH